MYIPKRTVKSVIILLLLIEFLALNSCSKEKKTTIYRDVWGVAHIYAQNENDLAFAFGYAQAEDRLEQILRSFRTADGTLSEAFGEKYVNTDYHQRVYRHAEVSRERFGDMSAEVQLQISRFVDGIKKYMQDHPDKVPDWAPEIYPWHVLAWGRTFIWGWPEGQAMDDLDRANRKPEPPHHSNEWTVNKERTATGAPIALLDPHLSFGSSGRWFEARLHAGDMQVCGMAVVGTPFIGIGHNEYISWAQTTGGPDCADVYELEINPQNPLQYKYDGKWREIIREKVIIKVKKKGGGYKKVEKTIDLCHYGPIVKRDGLKAYAVKISYQNEVGVAEQMLAMNKAKNLDEFKKALSMCQLMPQNIMFASIKGNIYYQRTGRVPIRPEGYNWDYPVPGNTSKSEWQGIHSSADLIQITNPETGFMQNCNISPGTMMPNSPFTKDKYPSYIYNDPQNRSNPRGRSALRLLGAENKLTIERAKQIALDTSVDGYKLWTDALQTAYNKYGRKHPDMKDAVNLITSWNGRLDKDNQSAALFRFWLRHYNKSNGKFPGDKGFSASDQKKMLKALVSARLYLTEKFGRYDVAWGETVRIKRDKKSWPVSGGSFRNGISVLRAAGGRFNLQSGVTYVNRGQSCCMVVSLKQPIESYSIMPWGLSDDPASPHYTDQTEELFSKSIFKPTYFNKNDLMKNLESTEELIITESD